MSLTSRLVLLVILALVGLGAATAVIVRTRRESDAAREKYAFAQGESVTKELLAKRDALTPKVASAMARGEPAPPDLSAFTATLLAPLGDASAGYCLPDGSLIMRESSGHHDRPPHDGPPHDGPPPFPGDGPPHDEGRPHGPPPRMGGLPPLDREFVVSACREQASVEASHLRFLAPSDVLFVTVAGRHEPFAEVARLDAVVGSLHLVARKDPAPLEDVDLSSLVDERIAALEPMATARSVKVVRRGDVHARIDPGGIARVEDNLVRNAVEASPEGANVIVDLDVTGPDVVVRVTDRGPGVPSEREAELFEPFFTSKPDGTGLGLSLSRAAVEAHGGTLVYGRDDDQTVFTVRLPGRALG